MIKTIRIERLGRWTGVGLMAYALVLSGCSTDKLLEVKDPETVNPGTLNDPSLLDVVVAGAKGNFTTAFSGGDVFLMVSAVMTDELGSAGTFPTRTATDRREQQPVNSGNTSDAAYTGLQRARRALKDAAAKVADFNGKSDPAYGEVVALEAYTYVLMGEGFCSAIPISNVDEGGNFVYGEPETVASIFSDASSLFDDALGNGGGSLAAVGKGRALLDQGQYSAAASAVSGVPTDYVYFIYHSESGSSNGIYNLQGNGRYSQADLEGGNGLPFRSSNDPRVPWIRDPTQPDGFDPGIPLYKSLKYTGFDSPVVLASGVEARLIEAEAALKSGDTNTWLSKLNALRANVGSLMEEMVPSYAVSNPTLDPLTDPGSDAARLAMMFSERGFWLYLTGHRLGDLRRMVVQYGMSQSDVFPTGAYFKGGSYGADVAFPVTFDETNNPNYQLSDCVVTQAN